MLNSDLVKQRRSDAAPARDVKVTEKAVAPREDREGPVRIDTRIWWGVAAGSGIAVIGAGLVADALVPARLLLGLLGAGGLVFAGWRLFQPAAATSGTEPALERFLREDTTPRAMVGALGEMIAADGNHASIFAWSVCNESDTRLPGGLDYVRRMKAAVRRLDPARFFTFADSDVSIAPWRDNAALHEADFLMANAYFGSWSGAAEQVEPWLDFIQKTYPEKALVISEYGFVGPFAPNAAEADRQRIANLRQQLDAFARRDFVAGAIFWIYQDYKSHRNLAAGETAGYVDHGVVDEHRQRKPSYAAYQQRNAPLTARLGWAWEGEGLSGFQAVLQANGAAQLPSYPLLGYRAEWRMTDRDGRLIGQGAQGLPDLAAPFTLQGRWPAEKGLPAATLRLRVVAPDGALALESRLEQAALRLGAAPFPAEAKPAPASRAPAPIPDAAAPVDR